MNPQQPALFAPNVVEMPAASYQPPPSEVQPSTEEPEMPKRKSISQATRGKYTHEQKTDYVRAILAGERTVSSVAAETGLAPPSIYAWIQKHRDKSKGSTLVSNGSPPRSEPLAKTTELPPPPAVHLTGLEDYIRAIVEREVEAALKAWKRRIFEGD